MAHDSEFLVNYAMVEKSTSPHMLFFSFSLLGKIRVIHFILNIYKSKLGGVAEEEGGPTWA